nr:Na+/H+ antiporter NhaA [Peristeroidobacter soli]
MPQELAGVVPFERFDEVLRELNERSGLGIFCDGMLLWLAIDASGIHATIAGVILGLLTPARRWVSDERLYAILDQVIAHPDADLLLAGGSHGNRKTFIIRDAEHSMYRNRAVNVQCSPAH